MDEPTFSCIKASKLLQIIVEPQNVFDCSIKNKC